MQPKVISRQEHCISRRNIDSDALKVLYRLYRAGFTVYLVGGGVRDLLLGRKPKDFDIATSARPSQLRRLFRNCRLVGRRFRLAHIHFGEDKVMEVSTFRREPDLETGMRDIEGDSGDDLYIRSDNTFGTPEQDALRRDFTINSLFYDIGTYSLIDYVGGAEDLKLGIIRTIGDPNLRFREDPVRMIRAVKFCARLGFKMDRAAWEGIVDNCGAIVNASAPRVQEEIIRLLESRSSERCMELLEDSGLLEYMVPELFSYLGRSREGGLAYDDDGQLLFRLLHQADVCRYALPRPLLYLNCLMPLLLEAGIFEEGGDDELRHILKVMSARLGICRRSQERCLQICATLRKMIAIDRSRGKMAVPRSFCNRGVFSETFELYKMLYGAGLVDEKSMEAWNRRLRDLPAEEGKQGVRAEGVAPAKGAANGGHKPKTHYLRRRPARAASPDSGAYGVR